MGDAQYIIDLINQYIRNYAVDAFKDQRLNMILNLMMQYMIANSGGGGGGTGSQFLFVTSSSFINATDCPLVALNGKTLAITWVDQGKILIQGVDWTPYVGGGFTIIIPGFDSSQADFTFLVFAQ